MDEKLKALEGLTYEEWGYLKLIIEEKFEKERKKNTFSCDENVLNKLNEIIQLKKHLIALQ